MEQFPVLILTGRPASGKSEIIDYLLHLDPVERLHRFRILIILYALCQMFLTLENDLLFIFYCRLKWRLTNGASKQITSTVFAIYL